MTLRKIVLLVIAALLSLHRTGVAQDTATVADAIVREIRALQLPDGSYGRGASDTCRVLDVLGRSPRRYTELDGPFVRRAAEFIIAAEAHGPRAPDGLVALALAGSLLPAFQATRDSALERLVRSADPLTYEELVALRTLLPEWPGWEAARSTPGDEAAACLVATAPAEIPAPPVEDVTRWTRWARAARLRGIKPAEIPSLPSVTDGMSLADLIGTLDTVIALHGIHKAAGAADDDGPPRVEARVPPGQDRAAALASALAFLDARQSTGTFGLDLPGWSGAEPGVTALCLAAACAASDALERPHPEWIGSGLDYLVSLQRSDGAILTHGLDVYTTSVAIEALLAGRRSVDRPVIARARIFLDTAQADEGEGYSLERDPHYGGIGYGGDERPDLSNTQMAIEASVRAGATAGSPFLRKAQVFLARCQNFGEADPQTWPRPEGGLVVSGSDGGATYMPGTSVAGEVRIAEGVYQPRSYGSMTYALLKSYLFCGLSPGDARPKAAVDWLARNFTVETNPGFVDPAAAAQGLYYYYVAMARTLCLLPEGSFRDPDGQPIAWRRQLERKLLDAQRADGSWWNEGSARWWEGAPTLCTAYALLALDAAAG